MADDDTRLEIIRDLSRKDDGEAVKRELLKYWKDYPESLTAKAMLAGQYFNEDSYVLAKPLFEVILEARPLDPLYTMGLFHVLLETDNVKDAQTLLSQYLLESNDNSENGLQTRDDFLAIQAEFKEKGLWIE